MTELDPQQNTPAPSDGIAVRNWLDKLEIRELLERYMRCNDDRAGDRLAELFDDDAILQVAGTVHTGREAIRSLFSTPDAGDPPPWSEPGELLKQPSSLHVMSNPIIEVDGDTATAESDFVVFRRDDAGKVGPLLAGRFRDRLARRGDGRWVITHRVGVSLARPGDEGTDAEWQRALARMPADERGNVRT